ncbi:hypothetical protein ACFFNY_23850 [Paenibacillus hodogayensis]|uniref:Uncharacterized protein n=1 Tax=Paenibacillus hodogayensis TaxID=279208 RepID=A0ABV5W233_9BACL
MQQPSPTNWITVLKWVGVLPMFLLAYVFMRVFFRFAFFQIVISPIAYDNLQLQFVLFHLYDQVLSVAFAIYVSCVLAPKGRVAIASVYMAIVLVTMPRQLELARENLYYGHMPWKTPFLIAAFLAGGLIPLCIMLYRKNKERKRSQAAIGPHG